MLIRSILAFVFLLCASCTYQTQVPAEAPKLPSAVNTDPVKGKVALPTPANTKLQSVFLIGDSTVRNGQDDGQGKGAEGQWGWGNPIAAYFDSKKINVVNRAIGGLSSRTYLTGGHWEQTLALVKPGDFVIMQFGHNDSGAINDDKRARASLKGYGEESEEIDNLLTKQHETVHTYGWYLRKFVADAKAKGATAIICSPIPRKSWNSEGKMNRATNSYGGWAAAVAKQENIGFIDLNNLAADKYDQLGRDTVIKLFPQVTPDEHTHTNLAGAELNAQLVIAGLKQLNKHPLAAYTNNKAPAKLFAEDDRPILDASKFPVEKALNTALPTFFIVGDSTVKNGANGGVGWGERLAPFFDSNKINVVNQAIGGRSSRTYFTEGRWDKVLSQLKKGDFVIIQFGHNDGARIGDPNSKNRGSVPGVGPETVEDTKPDGTKEQVHSFGWYMAKYITDAKAKGATVIICSPIPHKDKWETERDFESYAQWGEQTAKANAAFYFDLTLLVSDAYKKLGTEKVAELFSDARTHTNDKGAQLNAERVVAGLKGLKGNPLAKFYSAQAAAVTAAKR
jgi:lysophospholipase L1-like esterase